MLYSQRNTLMNWLELTRNGPHALQLGGEIEVLNWNYAAHLADNVPHRHTFFEVCFVGRHGAANFIVRGEAHVVAPGDLFFARPGVVHQIVNTARRGMELFWVCFSWKAPPDATAKTPREYSRVLAAEVAHTQNENAALLNAFADSPLLVAKDDGRVAALWRALEAVAATERAGSAAQIEGIERALILAIAQSGVSQTTQSGIALSEKSKPPRADEQIARAAMRYIADNLDAPLGVDEIAAHVHLSARHLARLFVRFCGVAPSAYIEGVRLERASALLASSDTPIKEIAQLCGYADVHYFTRRFRARCGVAPGGFREAPEKYVRKIHKHGDFV